MACALLILSYQISVEEGERERKEEERKNERKIEKKEEEKERKKENNNKKKKKREKQKRRRRRRKKRRRKRKKSKKEEEREINMTRTKKQKLIEDTGQLNFVQYFFFRTVALHMKKIFYRQEKVKDKYLLCTSVRLSR